MHSLRLFVAALAVAAGLCACNGYGGGSAALTSPAYAGRPELSEPKPQATTLLDFSEQTTGIYPNSSLTAVGNKLYGVTRGSVGNYSICFCGTVYSIAANGKATLLHQFTGGADGSEPSGALTYANGTFYGLTLFGGGASGCGSAKSAPLGCGTIYSITPAGKERVVYAFTDVTGYKPSGSIVYRNGKLYGVTPYGSQNQGTIWSFDLAKHTLTRLHEFFEDGAYAEGGLILAGSELYGTTSGYLAECPTSLYSCGTVFKIEPNGNGYTVLHTFDFADGASPFATVVSAGNYLYGTTMYGGKNCSPKGCGTIFSISPNGKFSTLWYFDAHGGDGYYPVGNLFLSGGTLYGVTQYGGDTACGSYRDPCGTVFESGTLAKSEHVLYSFDGTAGVTPGAGVIVRKSDIYGTTLYGGPDRDGSAYRLKQ
jgi:uncharacterized repeat protein (TIGR03803 family)